MAEEDFYKPDMKSTITSDMQMTLTLCQKAKKN